MGEGLKNFPIKELQDIVSPSELQVKSVEFYKAMVGIRYAMGRGLLGRITYNVRKAAEVMAKRIQQNEEELESAKMTLHSLEPELEKLLTIDRVSPSFRMKDHKGQMYVTKGKVPSHEFRKMIHFNLYEKDDSQLPFGIEAYLPITSEIINHLDNQSLAVVICQLEDQRGVFAVLKNRTGILISQYHRSWGGGIKDHVVPNWRLPYNLNLEYFLAHRDSGGIPELNQEVAEFVSANENNDINGIYFFQTGSGRPLRSGPQKATLQQSFSAR
jgi:hypothetical protein